jgi:hypothetical protein
LVPSIPNAQAHDAEMIGEMHAGVDETSRCRNRW